MFDNNLIEDGYTPMFSLIGKSIIEIVSLDLQLKLFNNRTKCQNIKTQHMQSEDGSFLLVLYIKNTDDDESLSFVLNNLVTNGNIILASNINTKKV